MRWSWFVLSMAICAILYVLSTFFETLMWEQNYEAVRCYLPDIPTLETKKKIVLLAEFTLLSSALSLNDIEVWIIKRKKKSVTLRATDCYLFMCECDPYWRVSVVLISLNMKYWQKLKNINGEPSSQKPKINKFKKKPLWHVISPRSTQKLAPTSLRIVPLWYIKKTIQHNWCQASQAGEEGRWSSVCPGIWGTRIQEVSWCMLVLILWLSKSVIRGAGNWTTGVPKK